ncbi:hypothetical protein K438DRAFT_1953998 [Mycena galopus ATCC 62051]|nr:hypothetical protein K438DRAFT_1953998 [Mycena galopus ATCC 62051]
MEDDLAELEVFLNAVFDSNFSVPPPTQVDMNVLIGVLRLSHKCNVLRRRAWEHLGTKFSTRQNYDNNKNFIIHGQSEFVPQHATKDDQADTDESECTTSEDCDEARLIMIRAHKWAKSKDILDVWIDDEYRWEFRRTPVSVSRVCGCT